MDTCHICGNSVTKYALNQLEQATCYDCCAVLDKQWMEDHNKVVLYLVWNNLTDQYELNKPAWEVTNWCGTLRFKANVKTFISKRAIWGIRHTFRFTDHAGNVWHGTQQGKFNDLARCVKQ